MQQVLSSGAWWQEGGQEKEGVKRGGGQESGKGLNFSLCASVDLNVPFHFDISHYN